MKVRKGRKWFKILKKISNKILIEKPKLFRKPNLELVNLEDFDEIR